MTLRLVNFNLAVNWTNTLLGKGVARQFVAGEYNRECCRAILAPISRSTT